MAQEPSATSSSRRPRVFFDIQCGADFFGRIVIELLNDKAPKTCENFRAICTSGSSSSTSEKPLTYAQSPFHRVIDEFLIQGGDITAGDGTGGASIYGEEFEDENLTEETDREGLVCMANKGKGTNTSQFFITLCPCPHLSGKNTVFGCILSGQDVLLRMAKCPVDANDRPISDIFVSSCGELERWPENRTADNLNLKPQPSPDQSPIDRGRKPNPPSPSRSRSQSPHPSRSSTKQRLPGGGPRRRSDAFVDETRRGRSPFSPNNRHQHNRRRSPPPSRSRSRSRSPRLRRRRSRSRSRSLGSARAMRGPPPRRNGRWRRVEEEISARAERSERIGRERRRGFLGGLHGDAAADRYYGGTQLLQRDVKRSAEPGRLMGEGDHEGDGHGWGDSGVAEVKFKGRGSMKYRERKS